MKQIIKDIQATREKQKLDIMVGITLYLYVEDNLKELKQEFDNVLNDRSLGISLNAKLMSDEYHLSYAITGNIITDYLNG